MISSRKTFSLRYNNELLRNHKNYDAGRMTERDRRAKTNLDDLKNAREPDARMCRLYFIIFTLPPRVESGVI